jgi:sugar phosphate isomerase/epimerase
LWTATNGATAAAAIDLAADGGPDLRFPSQVRERLAIASYPFREVIAGPDDRRNASSSKMDLKEFAAHVVAKFKVNKIEPWSRHFRSLDGKYLEDVRVQTEKARAAIVNIAVDGEHSPYAAQRAEREAATEFGKRWIDVAVAVGSPSVRINIRPAKDAKPDIEPTAESFDRVADYGSTKKVVVNLENDNPVSEDPFFILKIIEKVNSRWLHALPDFANTLATGNEEHAYTGIDAMFGQAYNICHVKAMEANESGQVFRVDLPRTFGMLKSHGYKGYCSMEWDSPGDPYRGTMELLADTVRYLS